MTVSLVPQLHSRAAARTRQRPASSAPQLHTDTPQRRERAARRVGLNDCEVCLLLLIFIKREIYPYRTLRSASGTHDLDLPFALYTSYYYNSVMTNA